jgi:hypothetical protein
MKKLFLILAILAFAVPAAAQPYVISEPQPDADAFRMRLSPDGITWGDWVEGPPVNGGMKFSIQAVQRGTYAGEAQAIGTTELTDLQTGQVSQVQDYSPSAKFTLIRRPGNAPAVLKTER